MSLFPLEYLIDNPYVMSHINTELMRYKESKWTKKMKEIEQK